MKTHATMQAVVEAASALLERLKEAPTGLAYTKNGEGPFHAILDYSERRLGPIQYSAERLRQALADHDRARREEPA